MMYMKTSRLIIALTIVLSAEAMAENYDLKTYAANFGISIEEAKEIFKLKKQGIQLGVLFDAEEKLVMDNPKTFAGFFTEHKPEKSTLVAQFSMPPKRPMIAYMNKELAESIEVRYVAISLAELRRQRTNAQALLKHAKINFSSDINLGKNRVELYVEKQKNFNDAIAKKLKAQLPKNVVLNVLN
ncbi:hypothetical protein [Crenothrix sp.]|uniref:hypothetical protein n=1 Tax=Crenothrix sp. TaxID=3100433 RepID=UPI00374C8B76